MVAYGTGELQEAKREYDLVRPNRADPKGATNLNVFLFLLGLSRGCGGDMAADGDLTDEERRALRGSKFAPLPAPPPSSRPNPRYSPSPFLLPAASRCTNVAYD